MFSHLYPFKIFLFSLITNIQSFHFRSDYSLSVFAEVLMFTGLGNPINSNAYFENVSYLLPTKKFFFTNMYQKNFILLHCSSLSFSYGNEKNFTVTFIFFFFQNHQKRSYQLMAPIASAPDQQISVAVSFWTQLSVCSETSAPWRVKELSLIFCLSSFSWQGWKWWLPKSFRVELQVSQPSW